ncbi:hypothetical protein [Bacteroides sp.]|uniref:hypothetical protein n=1 Tax=Bacteroides sp. TaxID=29523 RepID=UPI0026026EF1|nr:hypothetical protein [Bacteroides sp.]MDD3040055.1 hypothetical protein [Bacteroides sp.]
MKKETVVKISIAVSLAAIAYSVYTNARVGNICDQLNLAISDISIRTKVDVSNTIIEKAVEQAAEREVHRTIKLATAIVLKNINDEIYSDVKTSVGSSREKISESVAKEISKQVARIDIDDLKRTVRAEAKEHILEKFDGSLDSMLEDHNQNLTNLTKIYSSMAETMAKKV